MTRLSPRWNGVLPKNAVIMAKKGKARSPTESKTITVTPASPIENDSHQKIASDLEGCKRCKLCSGRNHIVIGDGSFKTDLIFVGEAPGEQEDLNGRPFVGRAGQLLEKMIEAMGLSRDKIYICNVVKCRPPENRNPEPDEIQSCSPFLFRQIDLIRPKVIVALGKFASQTLLQTETRISDLRGHFHPFRGAKLMPTYHPAYLLRNPSSKKEAWEDLKAVARELNLPLQ